MLANKAFYDFFSENPAGLCPHGVQSVWVWSNDLKICMKSSGVKTRAVRSDAAALNIYLSSDRTVRLSVCLGDVAMVTLFTACWCSKNGPAMMAEEDRCRVMWKMKKCHVLFTTNIEPHAKILKASFYKHLIYALKAPQKKMFFT